MADTGKLVFTDPYTAIEDEVTNLLKEEATFIIALGSAGYDPAVNLLKKSFNVDLIVNGGGSSTFLYNGGNYLQFKKNI